MPYEYGASDYTRRLKLRAVQQANSAANPLVFRALTPRDSYDASIFNAKGVLDPSSNNPDKHDLTALMTLSYRSVGRADSTQYSSNGGGIPPVIPHAIYYVTANPVNLYVDTTVPDGTNLFTVTQITNQPVTFTYIAGSGLFDILPPDTLFNNATGIITGRVGSGSVVPTGLYTPSFTITDSKGDTDGKTYKASITVDG